MDPHNWEIIFDDIVDKWIIQVRWCQRCGCLQKQEGSVNGHLIVTYRKPGYQEWANISPECT